MHSPFQMELQSKVLDLLSTKSLTITQLASQTKRNYHSVRKAVVLLQDEGKVKAIYTGDTRNIKYTIGEDTNINNSIPHVVIRSKRVKMHNAMLMNTDNVVEAAGNIPKHVTNLFMYAELAANGEPIDDRLQMLHARLEKDMEVLVTLTDVYRQILGNSKNWSPETIKRYLTDTVFDNDMYEKKKIEFFGEDN